MSGQTGRERMCLPSQGISNMKQNQDHKPSGPEETEVSESE